MNILAIDTTTKTASVSLNKDDEIKTLTINNEVTHSEKLLPLIDEILVDSSLKLKDIDIYACINGPGSFTGIRIGLSTLKAFSFVDKKNIFSVDSTDLIGITAYLNSNNYKNGKKATIVSLIDAKNERVYYSITELSLNKENKIETQKIIKTANDQITNVIEKVQNLNQNVIFAGNAINLYKEKLESSFSNSTYLDFYPTTKDLIIAYKKMNDTNSNTFDSYTLDANYARATQAERLKNERKD